jgi:hypothetical protein
MGIGNGFLNRAQEIIMRIDKWNCNIFLKHPNNKQLTAGHGNTHLKSALGKQMHEQLEFNTSLDWSKMAFNLRQGIRNPKLVTPETTWRCQIFG